MNVNRIHELIKYILQEAGKNEEKIFRELGPIHVIKYVYLADLYYSSQNNGITFTEIDWTFYKFGPWSRELYKELPDAVRMIGACTRTFESRYTEEDAVRFFFDQEYCYDTFSCSIPLQISSPLKRDIRTFGSATNDLLHYVYTTPPMTNAKPGEHLNFDHVLFLKKTDFATESSSELSDREKKKRKKLIADIRANIAKKREENKKNRIRPVPPRYDEVFYNGTMELDMDFEYPQIENHTGLLQVNKNAWSGNWRKSYELP